MLLLVTIVHFLIAVLLIVLVLVQDSKGGGAFGMGGTGSNQVLSATGAANFLVKLTRYLAIMFAVSCITLTYLTTHKNSGSALDGYVPAAGVSAPSGVTSAPTDKPAAAPVEPQEQKAPNQDSESK